MVQETRYRLKRLSTTFHYTWKWYELFVKLNQNICLHTVMNVYNSNCFRFQISFCTLEVCYGLLRSLIMESPLLLLPKGMAHLQKQDPEHSFFWQCQNYFGQHLNKNAGTVVCSHSNLTKPHLNRPDKTYLHLILSVKLIIKTKIGVFSKV